MSGSVRAWSRVRWSERGITLPGVSPLHLPVPSNSVVLVPKRANASLPDPASSSLYLAGSCPDHRATQGRFRQKPTNNDMSNRTHLLNRLQSSCCELQFHVLSQCIRTEPFLLDVWQPRPFCLLLRKWHVVSGLSHLSVEQAKLRTFERSTESGKQRPCSEHSGKGVQNKSAVSDHPFWVGCPQPNRRHTPPITEIHRTGLGGIGNAVIKTLAYKD